MSRASGSAQETQENRMNELIRELEEAVEMCKVFAKEWRQIAEGANHWMCDAKADAAEDIAEELRALKDQP